MAGIRRKRVQQRKTRKYILVVLAFIVVIFLHFQC